MTYSEFLSQFTVYEIEPKSIVGLHRHHIVPEATQKQLWGDVVDDRRVYVTPAQHMWLHILYDRENETNTTSWFLKICKKKDASYFDCFEKCLAYAYSLSKKDIRNSPKARKTISEKITKAWKNETYKQKQSNNMKLLWSDEAKRKEICEKMKGTNTHTAGSHWWNNGQIETMSKDCPGENWSVGRLSKSNKYWWNNGQTEVMSKECPEGFIRGRLKFPKK